MSTKAVYELSIFALLCFYNLTTLQAQHVHIQTLQGCTVDIDEKEPPCAPHRNHCCHPHYGYWQQDPIAEELSEDTGWPSRRDDELSDLLSR